MKDMNVTYNSNEDINISYKIEFLSNAKYLKQIETHDAPWELYEKNNTKKLE